MLYQKYLMISTINHLFSDYSLYEIRILEIKIVRKTFWIIWSNGIKTFIFRSLVQWFRYYGCLFSQLFPFHLNNGRKQITSVIQCQIVCIFKLEICVLCLRRNCGKSFRFFFGNDNTMLNLMQILLWKFKLIYKKHYNNE